MDDESLRGVGWRVREIKRERERERERKREKERKTDTQRQTDTDKYFFDLESVMCTP